MTKKRRKITTGDEQVGVIQLNLIVKKEHLIFSLHCSTLA